jgi:hypothetical protein
VTEVARGRLVLASSGRMRAREIERRRSTSAREAKEVGAASGGDGTDIGTERWRRRWLSS